MRAFVHNGYGAADALELVDVEKPVPSANEVLVKVVTTAINDWEWGVLRAPWFVRVALGWRRPRGKYRIMGCDMAGRVEAVGKRVQKFAEGDEVYGDLSGYRFGGFAEYVCVTEPHLRHKPPATSFEQAAAIPHAAELAWQAIKAAPELKPGQKVLINGAGGGVGTLAIQMLKQYDVEVTGVDRADKLELLRKLGYDHVLAWPDENFTRTGRQYDLIIDAKTHESAFDYLRALKPKGTYATVGGDRVFSFMFLALLINPFTNKRLKMVALKPNLNLSAISERFGSGELVPIIDGPFLFTAIREALTRFDQGRHRGKIIINVDSLQ